MRESLLWCTRIRLQYTYICTHIGSTFLKTISRFAAFSSSHTYTHFFVVYFLRVQFYISFDVREVHLAGERFEEMKQDNTFFRACFFVLEFILICLVVKT